MPVLFPFRLLSLSGLQSGPPRVSRTLFNLMLMKMTGGLPPAAPGPMTCPSLFKALGIIRTGLALDSTVKALPEDRRQSGLLHLLGSSIDVVGGQVQVNGQLVP